MSPIIEIPEIFFYEITMHIRSPKPGARISLRVQMSPYGSLNFDTGSKGMGFMIMHLEF